ncbi:MAG: hypothetical protein P0Y66_22175 [Candidatus Kaistia colombiensis]|nr:MAG: hypothetical protein P0Y66_22175 [Kaistia sp.]
MSITSLALQYLTVAALRGATLAGDAVQPGAIDALDVDVARMAKPLISVFIGEDERKISGKELIGGEHRVEVLIQTFLPAEVDILVDGVPLRTNSREGAADLVMGVMRRQIDRVLSAGDSPAANLWRILVAEVEASSTTPFLFQITDQVRVSANETSFLCRMQIDEPSFGAPVLSDFWQLVIDVLAAEPECSPIAVWIKAEIVAPENLPSWRIHQADLGLSAEARDGIGIGPLSVPEPASDELPLVSGGTMDTGNEVWTEE